MKCDTNKHAVGGTEKWLMSEASNRPRIRRRCEGLSGLRISTFYCLGHRREAADEVGRGGGATGKISEWSGVHSCVGAAVASEVGH